RFEESLSPTPLEHFLGRRVLCRLESRPFLPSHFVQGQKRHAAAPLLSSCPFPLTDEKPADGGEQQCSKLALGCVGRFQPLALQKAGEELLGEILCVNWPAPLPAYERVDGRPVALAKLLQRLG